MIKVACPHLFVQKIRKNYDKSSLSPFIRPHLFPDYALERGIIIADTKFEFGLDEANKLTLMDEVLTPDSSRFWSKTDYQVGISPKSFDKQIVRDYLETLDWDKTPPAPTLPENIVQKTARQYQEIQQILCK